MVTLVGVTAWQNHYSNSMLLSLRVCTGCRNALLKTTGTGEPANAVRALSMIVSWKTCRAPHGTGGIAY